MCNSSFAWICHSTSSWFMLLLTWTYLLHKNPLIRKLKFSYVYEKIMVFEFGHSSNFVYTCRVGCMWYNYKWLKTTEWSLQLTLKLCNLLLSCGLAVGFSWRWGEDFFINVCFFEKQCSQVKLVIQICSFW